MLCCSVEVGGPGMPIVQTVHTSSDALCVVIRYYHGMSGNFGGWVR